MNRKFLMSTWKVGRNQGCRNNVCQLNDKLKFWTWKLNEGMCLRDSLKGLNLQVIQTLLSKFLKDMRITKDKKLESLKHLKASMGQWESFLNTLSKRWWMLFTQNQDQNTEWTKLIFENTVLTRLYEQTTMMHCKKKRLSIYLVVIISFKHMRVKDS